MKMSEFEEAYEDKEILRGAILTTPLSSLDLREPIFVQAGASVVAAVNAMNEHRVGCVLVEESGQLRGILTERDVLTRVVFRNATNSQKVDAVMTPDPETLQANATIAFALNMMSVGGYRHIPVVDRTGRPIYVVSIRDLVNFLVDLFPAGVLNLPDNPAKAIPRTMDGG